MGAWIEIIEEDLTDEQVQKSHPTMGAWIEIFAYPRMNKICAVAPHDGCVD